MAQRLALACGLAVGLGLGGCKGGGNNGDGGMFDAVVYEVALNLPDGCPSGVENELGVGRTCTVNGGECKGGNPNLRCSCDAFFGAIVTGIPCFCTLLILAPTQGDDPCATAPANVCGTGASCCRFLNTGYFCDTNICMADGACPEIMPPGGGTGGAGGSDGAGGAGGAGGSDGSDGSGGSGP